MRTQKTVDFSPVNVLASEGIISQHSLIGGVLYGGTPTGKPYRVGDGVSSLETEHKETTIVIERVDEDDVWYTLSDL